MDLKVVIRELKNDELSHLDNFLYDAIFIPEGQEKPDKEIIKLPELSGYIKNFGKDTDHCLVAELNGELIGAIWTRIFSEEKKGFGFVDSKTPELSMSVVENYRKKGIGTKLLKAMLKKLNLLEYGQVSLSVDKQNFAMRLYQKFGFEAVKSDEKSAILIKRIKNMNEVDKYIEGFPAEVQDILGKIRVLIRENAPLAVESIAYGMPAYKTTGKPLVYFAAFKNHIGFYATPSGHEQFASELSAYKQGKGSVQFPIDKPIPYDLIKKIVIFRVKENAGKGKYI
ncbi:MAG: GNAT family N-acetyltransferase [Deltaproteobacteria bacterium]